MFTPNKIVSLKVINVFKSLLFSVALLGSFWMSYLALNLAGLKFPEVSADRLFDLGIFSLSTFSFITFLTMIPIQTTEAKLSPSFYARLIHNKWTHFGLYVIVVCSLISVLVGLFPTYPFVQDHLGEFYLANLSSIIFAIVFHRYWVLRNLYQPYIVYNHIHQLSKNENKQELWTELYEIAYKALKDGRLGNFKDFAALMTDVFYSYDKVQLGHFEEDLRSLYKAADNLRPAARYLEEKFPFLIPERLSIKKDSFERVEAALQRIR